MVAIATSARMMRYSLIPCPFLLRRNFIIPNHLLSVLDFQREKSKFHAMDSGNAAAGILPHALGRSDCTIWKKIVLTWPNNGGEVRRNPFFADLSFHHRGTLAPPEEEKNFPIWVPNSCLCETEDRR
jgi:hypothetical protein